MSAFNKVAKLNQKVHRERSQPAARAQKYGQFENKKTYKLRAEDRQKKEATLTFLKRKALNKNPDEFKFNMYNSQMEGGVHVCKDKTTVVTEQQQKLMDTQDKRYVLFHMNKAQKKLEKLQEQYTMICPTMMNTHIVFVDKKKGKKFDEAAYFNTAPKLVGRHFNRPTLEQLKTHDYVLDPDLEKERAQHKRQVEKKLADAKKNYKALKVLYEKMVAREHAKNPDKKVLVKDETATSAAQYCFAQKRKK